MTNYNRNLRHAHAEYRKVVHELEKFAKRSKHITILRHNCFYGASRFDIKVTKEGKVVREMYDYLLTLAPEHHKDTDKKYPTNWFNSVGYYESTEDEGECKNEWEFCVCHW